MTLHFSIIFPGPPVVFAVVLAITLALMMYWAVKFVVSIYTGA